MCAAYIGALSGPSRQPPTQTDIDALCTWLEAVESWTRASAHALAWTGAVRIEAQPTFTISVWRATGASGPVPAPEPAAKPPAPTEPGRPLPPRALTDEPAPALSRDSAAADDGADERLEGQRNAYNKRM